MLTNFMDSFNLFQQRVGIFWILWGWQSYFNLRVTGYRLGIGDFKSPTSAGLAAMF
jgi:hypothetical protein